MAKEWASGQAYVAEIVGRLKRTPWAELEALPAYLELAAPVDLAPFKFGQWKDTRAGGSLRIVVQQYRSGIVGRMAAEGFVVYLDGRMTAVPQDEMWEYT